MNNILTLKNLQKYKNTAILIGILAIISLIILIIMSSNFVEQQRERQNPLTIDVPTSSSPAPSALIVNWSLVQLGMNKQKIDQTFGNPITTTQLSGGRQKLEYQTKPNSPANHIVVLQNDSAVVIARKIDSTREDLPLTTFEYLYGNGETVRQQTGGGFGDDIIYAIDKFSVSDNTILLTEYEEQTRMVYKLYYLFEDQQSQVNDVLPKIPSPEEIRMMPREHIPPGRWTNE